MTNEDRSEKIRKILEKNPPFIIRSGNSILLIVVIVLLLSLFVISIPNTEGRSIGSAIVEHIFISVN